LHLERGRAPIPEKLLAPCEIEQRRRVAPQGRPGAAKGAPTPIRERPGGRVAARARAVTVAGEPHVGEEPGTEGDLLGRERVLGRRRRWTLGPPEHLPPWPRGVRVLGHCWRRPHAGEEAQHHPCEGCQTDVALRHAWSSVRLRFPGLPS